MRRARPPGEPEQGQPAEFAPIQPWLRPAIALALVALVFAAFSPALWAGFVDWDDDRNFIDNYAYRGLSAQHLAWMATTRHMGHYQPLSWLTLGLDHALWGMNAQGYHATSVLLHALTAVAFYALARRLLPLCLQGARLAQQGYALDLSAATAASLFALHPLRCESVAWITARRDVLSGLFLVLALWAYLVYAGAALAARRRWYALALALFCCSLLSKASGFVLPVVLLVLDGWPLRRFGRVGGERLGA